MIYPIMLIIGGGGMRLAYRRFLFACLHKMRLNEDSKIMIYYICERGFARELTLHKWGFELYYVKEVILYG